jgi:hypothetical protein
VTQHRGIMRNNVWVARIAATLSYMRRLAIPSRLASSRGWTHGSTPVVVIGAFRQDLGFPALEMAIPRRKPVKLRMSGSRPREERIAFARCYGATGGSWAK